MHTIKGGDDCDWWDGLSRGTEQWKLIIAQVESWCGAFPGHPISELYITSGGTFIGRPIEQLIQRFYYYFWRKFYFFFTD